MLNSLLPFLFLICKQMFDLSIFFRFIKSPKNNPINDKKGNIVLISIKLFLFLILIGGLINFLSITIIKQFITLPVDEALKIPDALKNRKWLFIFFVSILAPVYEEIIFRLPLNFKPINLALSITFFIGGLLMLIENTGPSFLIPIFLVIIFILLYKLCTLYSDELNTFWKINFSFIVYLFSFLFGLVHISNYSFQELTQFFVVPILILPQLFVGFVFAFVRTYYLKGLVICIITHIFINSFAALITF